MPQDHRTPSGRMNGSVPIALKKFGLTHRRPSRRKRALFSGRHVPVSSGYPNEQVPQSWEDRDDKTCRRTYPIKLRQNEWRQRPERQLCLEGSACVGQE